ncbi:MAG: hypothetical protein ACT6T3_22055 [Agrobacterium sp.]|uniref:hypothetical protein n=1 Tax=Agrobacterium sp. TaxID=361 RepID=UPI004033EBE0
MEQAPWLSARRQPATTTTTVTTTTITTITKCQAGGWGCPFVALQITSLAFSQDGHTLLSRSLDSSLKVWDLRK